MALAPVSLNWNSEPSVSLWRKPQSCTPCGNGAWCQRVPWGAASAYCAGSYGYQKGKEAPSSAFGEKRGGVM